MGAAAEYNLSRPRIRAAHQSAWSPLRKSLKTGSSSTMFLCAFSAENSEVVADVGDVSQNLCSDSLESGLRGSNLKHAQAAVWQHNNRY
jgi:hypothetical protein